MSTGNPRWERAIDRMRERIDQTLDALQSEFPHWADATTGKWTTTVDGDWTGGAFPGTLWLLARRTGDAKYRNAARLWSSRLRPRAQRQTVFKGFGFYYGVALGDVLCAEESAASLALDAAQSRGIGSHREFRQQHRFLAGGTPAVLGRGEDR